MTSKARCVVARMTAAAAADDVCARCAKRVYAIERIKCLEKSWHKTCFRCTVCQTQLTMNTYKGFNRMPYCKVHYPTQKHTLVPDTPELKRLTNTTRMQSNILYGEDGMRRTNSQTPLNTTNLDRELLLPTILPSSNAAKNSQESYRPLLNQIKQIVHTPHSSGCCNAERTNSTSSTTSTSATSAAYAHKSMERKLIVQATYDYSASEPDELTFTQGDIIYDCEYVDSGWMIGTHAKSKKRAMLPANYVLKLI